MKEPRVSKKLRMSLLLGKDKAYVTPERMHDSELVGFQLFQELNIL